MSENYKNYIWQAKHYRKVNWLKACEILEKGIEEFPTEKELHFELAEIYISKQQFKKALGYLQTAHKIDKEDTSVLFKMANCFLSVDEPEIALSYYNKIKGDFAEAMYNKAIALARLNRALESIEELKRLIALNPDTDLPYHFIVEQYIALHDYKTALEYLEKTEKIFSPSGKLSFWKAICYSSLSQWLKAYLEFQNAEKFNIQSANFYHAYGICCENIGKTDIAIDYLNTSINIDKTIITTYLDLVKILINHEMIDEAHKVALMAKAHNPDSQTISMIYSKILQLLKKNNLNGNKNGDKQ